MLVVLKLVKFLNYSRVKNSATIKMFNFVPTFFAIFGQMHSNNLNFILLGEYNLYASR